VSSVRDSPASACIAVGGVYSARVCYVWAPLVRCLCRCWSPLPPRMCVMWARLPPPSVPPVSASPLPVYDAVVGVFSAVPLLPYVPLLMHLLPRSCSALAGDGGGTVTFTADERDRCWWQFEGTMSYRLLRGTSNGDVTGGTVTKPLIRTNAAERELSLRALSRPMLLTQHRVCIGGFGGWERAASKDERTLLLGPSCHRAVSISRGTAWLVKEKTEQGMQ